ncbi:DinB family protein [Streptomyces sp. BE308]|uniref:mycothiol transferase n=1 Tax=unclassified Streptomyces TaxID=2593676 RepID=UPI002E780A73|nr:DinB family protein [Streptomyces sp. BE308]MEE1795594.1 DinB family protein [Streptomyces sp. BE308]
MNSAGLLAESFGRVREAVHSAAEGLPPDHLNARLDDGANSIAWLLWHLARVQDDHIADAAGTEEVWLAQGWSDRFALPFEERATGYGHSAEEVAAVRVDSAEPLLGYYDAVHERTLEFVTGLNGHALDRIVDEGWSPPVTLGVRLVSVLAEGLQHAGQAAFVRGSLQRA